ncbi:MAG: hypothetical protein QMD50_03070 [Patescibacteria group bacterium]|nr:hypothetical protein [Patescibacteria group bacterium]
MNFKSEKPAVSFAFFVALAVVLIVVALLLIFYRKPMTEEEKQMWRMSEEQKVAEIVSTGNFNKCSEVKYIGIDGIDYKTVCQNNIALNKARQTLNISWCSKIDNILISKSECEQDVIQGMLLKDNKLSVCDIVSNNALKKDCVSSYWYLKAIADKNAAVCKNSPEPQACEEIYWIDQLQQNPNSVSCSKISLATLKNDCNTFKKSLIENDWLKKMDLCGDITSSIDLQLMCQK